MNPSAAVPVDGRSRTARAQAPLAQGLGAHLPPLLVAAERIAATVAQGVHGRRRVGQGDSFWQFRSLLPGEPAARIDWRRSARSDRGHFVRQNEWEAAQTVSLWRAPGAGMRWRSLPSLPEKQERADLLLLALAALLLRGGERVRLLRDSPVDVIGQTGLVRVAAALDKAREETSEQADPMRMPRYGCVVLMGDFLDAPETTRSLLAGISSRHASGHVLQILDPAEVTLPFAGRLRFTSPRANGASALVGKAEALRHLYAEKLAELQAGLAAACQAAGMSFSVHRTDHPATAALLALHVALAGRSAK